MKRVIEDISGQGLESLLGKPVQLWCMNYIYTGTLIGVDELDVLLTDAAVVYETGLLTEPGFKDAQSVGHDLYVRVGSIESYSEV